MSDLTVKKQYYEELSEPDADGLYEWEYKVLRL
jgi:hypothetical protein